MNPANFWLRNFKPLPFLSDLLRGCNRRYSLQPRRWGGADVYFLCKVRTWRLAGSIQPSFFWCSMSSECLETMCHSQPSFNFMARKCGIWLAQRPVLSGSCALNARFCGIFGLSKVGGGMIPSKIWTKILLGCTGSSITGLSQQLLREWFPVKSSVCW